MSDLAIRAALRGLSEEDVPFIVDLLERLSGQKWQVAPDNLPTVEEIMLGMVTISIGDMVTARYRGHSVALSNRPRVEYSLALKLRDRL